MHQLLIACFCLLSQALLAQTHKPQLLQLSKPALFEKLTADLKADRLFRLYHPHFKLKQVKRNRPEPAIKVSVLTVITPADQVTLFKNRYAYTTYAFTDGLEDFV